MTKTKFMTAIMAVAAMLFASTPVYAGSPLGELNIFNHLAISASVSTNGIGIEAATPVTNWLALRGGVSILPNVKFSTSGDVDVEGPNNYSRTYDVDLDLGMGRTQGQIILNFYPLRRAFPLYIAAGAYIGGDKIIKIDGHSEQLRQDIQSGLVDVSNLEIGDYQVPLDPKTGDVRAGMKVKSVRPYVGVGFGQAIPKHRINFTFELGAQFHGKMKPYSEFGTVSEGMVEEAGGDLKKIMDKLTIYPVISFKLSGKIF